MEKLPKETMENEMTDESEHKKVSKDEFKDAVKQILLSSPEKKELLEKRMPTREELEKKWKLEKEDRS